MVRRSCCAKIGLNRGSWSSVEDQKLAGYVKAHGEGKWRDLPQKAGLKRCGKSCRLRWMNYLRPGIKRGNISPEEEELIVRLHKLLGNRWSLIAGRLPGRTDNEVKNYWKTYLSKKGLQGDDIKKKEERSTSINKVDLLNPINSTGKSCKAIRTKAIRCTRVINILEMQLHNSILDLNHDHNHEKYVNSGCDYELNPFPLAPEDDLLNPYKVNSDFHQASHGCENLTMGAENGLEGAIYGFTKDLNSTIDDFLPENWNTNGDTFNQLINLWELV